MDKKNKILIVYKRKIETKKLPGRFCLVFIVTFFFDDRVFLLIAEGKPI